MTKLIYGILSGLLIIAFIVVAMCFSQFFKVDADGLPKIHFYKRSAIPFRKKAPAYMSYVSNNPEIDHIYLQRIRAKARGGANEDFPKHNFTIELSNKHQLAGLKSEDDWIIAASYLDKSFLRHKLSFDLFKQYNTNYISPECEFVEVYRNFEYNGLYVIMERMDCKRLGIIKKDSAACIYKEPPVFIDPKIKVNSNPYIENDSYHQKFPDLSTHNKSSEIKKLREFIAYAHDSVFEKEIVSYFNLNDIIDWHLLLMITHNDAVTTGFYLYRKDSYTPFRLALWDYDNSFGRDTDNEAHLPGIINWRNNTLLERLSRSNTHKYNLRLKKRLNELVESGIFSTENIVSLIEENYMELKHFPKKNEVRWPINAKEFYDDADFEDEIRTMKNWIPMQLKEIHEHVSGL